MNFFDDKHLNYIFSRSSTSLIKLSSLNYFFYSSFFYETYSIDISVMLSILMNVFELWYQKKHHSISKMYLSKMYLGKMYRIVSNVSLNVCSNDIKWLRWFDNIKLIKKMYDLCLIFDNTLYRSLVHSDRSNSFDNVSLFFWMI